MDALSETQLSTLRNMFAVFSSDSRVGEQELRIITTALGLSLTRPQLQDLIARVDIRGEGSLDYDEFVQLLTSPLGDVDIQSEVTAGTRQRFSHTSKLTLTHLTNVILPKHTTHEHATRGLVFASFDRDHDGILGPPDILAALAATEADGTVDGPAGLRASVQLTPQDVEAIITETEGSPGARGITQARFASLLHAQMSARR